MQRCCGISTLQLSDIHDTLKWLFEENVSYIWDWGEKRQGSYVTADGESTSTNRYTIDWGEMAASDPCAGYG